MHQSSTERRAETPKRWLNGTGLIDPSVDSMEPPGKIARFELSGNSSSFWKINSELAESSNKHIKNFISNQTLAEGILPTKSRLIKISFC